MNAGTTEASINEYGRFADLKKTVDREKAKAYFEVLDGTIIPEFKLSMRIESLLKEFILCGGFDVSGK